MNIYGASVSRRRRADAKALRWAQARTRVFGESYV